MSGRPISLSVPLLSLSPSNSTLLATPRVELRTLPSLLPSIPTTSECMSLFFYPFSYFIVYSVQVLSLFIHLLFIFFLFLVLTFVCRYDINLVDIAPEVKDVATTALTIAAYNASFYNVNIYGFQDTLWFLNGRSYGYFKNCYVEGGVDFIYGSGVAFFDSCTIASNRDGAITAMQGGSATAIGHYVFQYCNIIPTLPSGPLAALADPDLSYTDPSQFPRTVFLGRPWDQFSRVVYLHSALGEHIAYEGWTSWQVPQGQLYGEYNNTGLGIFNDQRVSFATALNSVEAASYTFERFFGQNPAWLDTRYAPIRPDQCTASVSVIARPGNSWVANGQNFQVYEVKVHNIGDKKIKTLNVNINVGTATFNQKWNLNQVGENQYALPDWYQGFYVDGTSSDAGFIIGDSNALAPSVSIASLTC